jgi:hypothetical protein
METMANPGPPLVRCGMCGGKTRIIKDPLILLSARCIECKDGCSWSSLDPRRIKWYPYWWLRVKIGK